MPPEQHAGDAAGAARALWRELAGIYDTLERELDAAAWDDVAGLATRLGELETALRPLMRARPSAPVDAGAARVWTEVDATATRLAARLPALLARVETAHRDVGRQLARGHAARTGTRTYRATTVAPRFASQRV